MIRGLILTLIVVISSPALSQSSYQVNIPEKTVTLAPGVFIQQNGWRIDSIIYQPDNTDVNGLGTKPQITIFFQGTFKQDSTVYAVPNVGKTLTITDASTLAAMAGALAKTDSTQVLDAVIDVVWRKAAPALGVPDSCIKWTPKVNFP